MDEIKVTTPEVLYTPSQVVCDFTALDTEIEAIEKRYLKWVPSENEIKEAERIAKDINGVAKNLNDEKVRIKKDMNKESKLFEDETMIRVNRLKAVRQNVLDGLDVYEQERIKTRKNQVKDYLEEHKGDLDIPFDVIFESRYTNKSCTDKEWKSDVKRKIDGHHLDFDLLKKMNYEDIPLLQSIYMQKWDRLSAIDEYENQMQAKKLAEEIKQKQEKNFVKPIIVSEGPAFTKPSYIETILKPDDFKTVNEMVSIRGNQDEYKKAKAYAQSLGLTWDEL